jgi:hypothetical protein
MEHLQGFGLGVEARTFKELQLTIKLKNITLNPKTHIEQTLGNNNIY